MDIVLVVISFKRKIGPQLFHRDYESFNFVKLFVYLTDVGKENGPHEYIIRSNIKDNFERSVLMKIKLEENFQKVILEQFMEKRNYFFSRYFWYTSGC